MQKDDRAGPDLNVVDAPPKKIRSRFELAARSWIDGWLATGSMHISARDLQIVREFLELAGMRVEEVPGLLVRVVGRGHAQEVSREGAALMALRYLADQDAA